MRAKFHTESVTNYAGGNTSVVLSPVSKGASDENTQFWQYTPSGKLEMFITNPSATQFFEPGKDYYLDFTPVE